MVDIFVRDSKLNADDTVIAIHVCRPDGWDELKATLTSMQRTFSEVRGFKGNAGQRVQLPNDKGHISTVIFGAGDEVSDHLNGTRLGGLSSVLPEGHYKLASMPADWLPAMAATGWGLGAYKFDRYLKDPKTFPTLVVPDGRDSDEVEDIVFATHLGRDLINTPASDMGPEALEKAARDVATRRKADLRLCVGEDLLKHNYPMIHAVGRAGHQAPRLVELEWGNPDHPRLALVGKGITFDTGGVNIKSAGSARLMKKDMGGAAHALALADLIMARGLNVRLHLLLAIAENAVSSNAYRPGDILTSRSGHTVEIDNTDAEGRLVLADALTRATEDDPELIIDFATLTGAARVALGPTLPPFFSNRQEPVADILSHGTKQADPLWQMPLWEPYFSMLSSPIADMKNSGGGFAGSVTAALFLQKFVDERPWMHLDVYGWNPTAFAGHPKGGEIYGIRALYHWIKGGGLGEGCSS